MANLADVLNVAEANGIVLTAPATEEAVMDKAIVEAMAVHIFNVMEVSRKRISDPEAVNSLMRLVEAKAQDMLDLKE